MIQPLCRREAKRLPDSGGQQHHAEIRIRNPLFPRRSLQHKRCPVRLFRRNKYTVLPKFRPAVKGIPPRADSQRTAGRHK